MTAMLIARVVHVLVGATWVGFAVFLGLFLMPTLRAVGPAGGAVMQHLTQVRRLPIYMMLFTIITLLSGMWLSWHDMGEMGMAWFKQGSGRVFGTGAVLAFLAAIVGMAVSSPSARKLGNLATAVKDAGRAPTSAEAEQMMALQKRLGMSATIVMVLVIGAIAAMSVARYVG